MGGRRVHSREVTCLRERGVDDVATTPGDSAGWEWEKMGRNGGDRGAGWKGGAGAEKVGEWLGWGVEA